MVIYRLGQPRNGAVTLGAIQKQLTADPHVPEIEAISKISISW
jgi:hypothetical protein